MEPSGATPPPPPPNTVTLNTSPAEPTTGQGALFQQKQTTVLESVHNKLTPVLTESKNDIDQEVLDKELLDRLIIQNSPVSYVKACSPEENIKPNSILDKSTSDNNTTSYHSEPSSLADKSAGEPDSKRAKMESPILTEGNDKSLNPEPSEIMDDETDEETDEEIVAWREARGSDSDSDCEIDESMHARKKESERDRVIESERNKPQLEFLTSLKDYSGNLNAIPKGTFEDDWTPMMLAAKYRMHELIPMLIRRGDVVNPELHPSPLAIAIQAFCTNFIKILLDNGANVNSTTADGVPLLLDIIHRPQLAKSLLERGANMNCKDKNGLTPFIKAVKNNFDVDFVAQLMQRKDIDLKYMVENSPTPLLQFFIHSLPEKHEDKLKYINRVLDKTDDYYLNVQDEKGQTPLHKTVSSISHADITKILINKKADLNIKNNKGLTPLALAVTSLDCYDQTLKKNDEHISNAEDIYNKHLWSMSSCFALAEGSGHASFNKKKIIYNKLMQIKKDFIKKTLDVALQILIIKYEPYSYYHSEDKLDFDSDLLKSTCHAVEVAYDNLRELRASDTKSDFNIPETLELAKQFAIAENNNTEKRVAKIMNIMETTKKNCGQDTWDLAYQIAIADVTTQKPLTKSEQSSVNKTEQIKFNIGKIETLCRAIKATHNEWEKQEKEAQQLNPINIRINHLKFLIENDAKVNSIDNKGRSVLDLAIKNKVPPEIINLLETHGAKRGSDLNEYDIASTSKS